MVVVFILFPNPKFNSCFLGPGSGAGDRLIVTYLSQVLFLGTNTRARALIVLVSNRVLKKSLIHIAMTNDDSRLY